MTGQNDRTRQQDAAQGHDSAARPDRAERPDRVERRDEFGQNAGDDALDGDRDDRRLSLGQIVRSVLAAALGVQSSENRERDFRQGRALTFIIAGVVSTAIFIGVVLAVVKLVLASS